MRSFLAMESASDGMPASAFMDARRYAFTALEGAPGMYSEMNRLSTFVSYRK